MRPPVPGDALLPFTDAAATLGLSADALQRTLYDDRSGARRLRRVPDADGRALLARYNLELARVVLRDATRVELHARGGWRDVFRAVKAAVKLVGFWTPEYLTAKIAKVRATGNTPLVLVVAKALAVGGGGSAMQEVGGERMLWCGRHPRVGDVMRLVERVAKAP